MSDEEWDTTDDSSSGTESLPDGADEKCPYCDIYKVMAESRLFDVPETLRDENKRWTPDDSKNKYLLKKQINPYYPINK